MKLIRTEFRVDGIFGRLYNDHGVPIAYTLEHSFLTRDGTYIPALYDSANGFTCVRGTHKLHNLVPFETFEITNVQEHFDILFHAGNYNKDTEGCVLLGHAVTKLPDGTQMLTSSKVTFQEFMQSLEGKDSFHLTVTSTKPK